MEDAAGTVRTEPGLHLRVAAADLAPPLGRTSSERSAAGPLLGAGTVKPPALSIVIPAYNERDRLPDVLAALRSHVDLDGTEVIVVDDGSTDDTAAIAALHLEDAPLAGVVSLAANRGKGGAVREGMMRARGAAIVYMDADHATDLRCLDDLLAALDEVDVAIGSRAHEQSVIHESDALRSVMGREYNRIVRKLTGLPFLDTQCGFKAFRAPAAKLLFSAGSVDGFAFDVEVLANANRLGLTTAEVPVQWQHVEGSKIRRILDPLKMTVDTVRSARRTPTFTVEGIRLEGTHWTDGGSMFPPVPHWAFIVPGATYTEILLPGADHATCDQLATDFEVCGYQVFRFAHHSSALLDDRVHLPVAR